jgi:hypothetical protein
MALNPFATSGTKIYIAAAAASEPADAAAYAALTWVEIGNIASYAPLGDKVNIINAPVVGDSRIRKAAGSRDAGDVTLKLYPDDTDSGQTALVAAAVTNSTYPFKLEYPSREQGDGAGRDGREALLPRRGRRRPGEPRRQRGHHHGRIYPCGHDQNHSRGRHLIGEPTCA